MKSFKFIIGLLLLPSCAAALLALPPLLALGRATHQAAPFSITLPAWWFLAGFGLWVILYLCLPRPTRTYVLGHELTHLLWAWLLGIRASHLRVTASGGSVHVAENHFLISLAPYFFPLYTLLVVLLRFILNMFFDTSTYEPFWHGLLGLTWSFHLTFTASMLKQHQPDILQEGRTFSYAVILLLNALGIGLVIVALTPATLEDHLQLFLRAHLLIFDAERRLFLHLLHFFH